MLVPSRMLCFMVSLSLCCGWQAVQGAGGAAGCGDAAFLSRRGRSFGCPDKAQGPAGRRPRGAAECAILSSKQLLVSIHPTATPPCVLMAAAARARVVLGSFPDRLPPKRTHTIKHIREPHECTSQLVVVVFVVVAAVSIQTSFPGRSSLMLHTLV